MTINETKPVVVPQNGGTVLNAFGDEITVKLVGAQTRGQFALFSDAIPPGGGPPPHYHLNEDEMFIVQEGRVAYLIEGRWTELGKGGVVFAPRGSIHAFRNTGDTPARHWVLTTPSGFENFFSRCGEEFARPGGPDMNRIVEISAGLGLYFVDAGMEGKPEPQIWTDEQAIVDIVKELERAWNAGDSAGFARHFAEDADFVDILGRHHKGRATIEAGHREIFETFYRGSRNHYEVEGVRFVRPEVAVVFVLARLTSRLGGAVDAANRELQAREEMSETQARPTLVLEKAGGRWRIAAFQNTKLAVAEPKVN